ncbi:MAG: hypothetical protein R2854_20525 [Caldilineaceae bacterium]
MAQTHTAAELEMRGSTSPQTGWPPCVAAFSALLYPSDRLRARGRHHRQRTGPARTVALCHLGRLSILLVCVDEELTRRWCREALRPPLLAQPQHAHQPGDPQREGVQLRAGADQVGQLLQRNDHRNWLNRRRHLPSLRNDHQLTGAAKTLLQTAARRPRTRGRHLGRHQYAPLIASERVASVPARHPAPKSRPRWHRCPVPLNSSSTAGWAALAPTMPVSHLPGPGQTARAVERVIANPTFGFLMTERGSNFTWAVNSGENRLTPWSNDPVVDPRADSTCATRRRNDPRRPHPTR